LTCKKFAPAVAKVYLHWTFGHLVSAVLSLFCILCYRHQCAFALLL